MKSVIPYFVAFSVVFAFVSCKKDKPEESDPIPVTQLQMDLFPVFGQNELKLDSVYITDEGYKVKFTELKCYLENITNGSKVLKDVALFDYRESGTFLFRADDQPGDYTDLTMNIGVQNSLNHADPAEFSSDSPLNIMVANDMHWGWNPGYIFFKVEAKADTIVDAVDNYDLNVVFHIGTDVNLRDKAFTGLTWNKTADYLYKAGLILDMQKFLRGDSNPIDLQNEFTSHSAGGQEVLSTKAADNFKYALDVQ